jgi:hypothetical protein
MIMSLPNAAGTTTDTTHSDHYANGDKYSAQVQGSAVFGNFWMMVQFYADNGTVTETVSPVMAPGTTTPVYCWHGQGAAFTLAPVPTRAAHVASNFQFYSLVANATSFAVVSMKNGSVGNASISVPASTTGLFEDTTHSDSVAVGDLHALRTSLGTPTAGNNFRVGWSMTYSGIASETEFAPVYETGPSSGVLSYAPIVGTSTGSTTEAEGQQSFGFGGTISGLRINVDANGFDGQSPNVFIARKNGVDQSLTVTVPDSSTGTFEDSTHVMRFLPTDLMCVSWQEVPGGFFSFLIPSSGLFLLTPDPEVLRVPQRHYLRR